MTNKTFAEIMREWDENRKKKLQDLSTLKNVQKHLNPHADEENPKDEKDESEKDTRSFNLA